jgi:hypothetical protein
MNLWCLTYYTVPSGPSKSFMVDSGVPCRYIRDPSATPTRLLALSDGAFGHRCDILPVIPPHMSAVSISNGYILSSISDGRAASVWPFVLMRSEGSCVWLAIIERPKYRLLNHILSAFQCLRPHWSPVAIGIPSHMSIAPAGTNIVSHGFSPVNAMSAGWQRLSWVAHPYWL